MFSLEGRVALVTGSSKGLGKAIALGLGKAGARVAINYQNNAAKAEATAEELRRSGCKIALVRANVIDAADVQRLCETVAKELGPIDILIPNATPDQPQKPIEQYDWDFYQSMIDFFLKSPYLLTRATLPHMKQQKFGRIINITSEVFHLSVGNFSAYVAAKGAQIGWSRSMATELAPHGITVNTIAPGWIPVERHEKDPQEVKDAYLASIPARRWGTPEDVANAAVYYASTEAAFVTGQTLCVNGGATPW
ncbi:MAG: 3-oxoacyl-ACP reductase FabG [Planctomycetes bacterium]|nr:3-oxoacyl-ACP reductase FabG [Planctomycetota bacterium]